MVLRNEGLRLLTGYEDFILLRLKPVVLAPSLESVRCDYLTYF